MKHVLVLEATFTAPADLLHQVVAGVRDFAVAPESLVWTFIPGSNEARVWAILSASPEAIEMLVSHFRSLPGVRKVELGGNR